MGNKTLLSLFDYSGRWALPFHNAGWNVIQLDIKRGNDLNDFKSIEDIFDWGITDVDGIIAAPPCTDFAASGAQYWPKKDANGTTEKSLELVRQVQRFANLFYPTDPEYFEEGGTFFWACENPVGRFGKLSGEENPLYFDPYEFAGYLNPTKKQLKELDRIRAKNGEGVTAEENELVLDLNAYTKKTGLWGCFNRELIKKPIAPVKTSKQGSPTQRLGGKSDKTKEERSFTPDGFAQAFFEANCNWAPAEFEAW